MTSENKIASQPIVVGAGVGGVAAAIVFQEAGLDPIIIDQCNRVKLLEGAGINLQARAIEALNSFGLSTSTLIAAGCPISKQSYYLPDGRHVASLDKSGKGRQSPGQIGIQRGELVQLLLDLAESKGIKLMMSHRVLSVDDKSSPDKVTVKAKSIVTDEQLDLNGSMVLGADGINSTIRRYYIVGNENKDPRHRHANTHYRGVCESFPSFLDGHTMILAGGLGVKAVIYPIGHVQENGMQRINWVLAVDEESYNPDRSTYPEYIMKLLKENGFNLGFLDIYSLIKSTSFIKAYPMVDLNPLKTWTKARIALMGDAAHGMLPVGSGGAMAALFDAEALRDAFEAMGTLPLVDILRNYEQMRYKDASLHQKGCRLQPAETIVQEAMDSLPKTGDVPLKFESRIQEAMGKLHSPQSAIADAKPIVVGAGVGGVACAVVLKDAGFDPVIIDQCSMEKLLEGAGINLQYKAIQILNSIGLSVSSLSAAGCPIAKQSYYLPDGRHVASLDKSARDGIPGQIGIHRGALVHLLLGLAEAKGVTLKMQHRVTAVVQRSSSDKVSIRAKEYKTNKPLLLDGSMVLGADGVNSMIRKYYVSGNTNKDPRHYHGHTHYRGVCESFPSFKDGHTMILAGGLGVKAVVYPIGHVKDGMQKINWVIAVDTDENEGPESHGEYIGRLLKENDFNLGFLDIHSLIKQTSAIKGYPMVDLEPLETWTDYLIALVGDSAHGMLPVGSGGAMSALFDANALREALENAGKTPINEILRNYEKMRYEAASWHQQSCRKQPAETIVQEAMDTLPKTGDVPPEFEKRIQEIMTKLQSPPTTS